MLDYIETQINNTPEYLVIWLHGLGASGDDLAPLAVQLSLSRPTVHIFPHADIMPISINAGYSMRAWYDIYDASLKRSDLEGINHSFLQIEQLICKLMDKYKLNSNRILLVGFSQGGVMAHTTCLLSQYKLCGFIPMSCYLPNAEHFIKQSNHINIGTPVFICHGNLDVVVPYHLGEQAYLFLDKHHYNTTWHSYNIGHSIDSLEMQNIEAWINQLIES